ncbi:MAG: outer membrane lipoprotein-sorting protein [Proteobacteria bacterium]|nr:outer membrane lipoprotein-sorting protein [Pseudomonadota bacterium]
MKLYRIFFVLFVILIVSSGWITQLAGAEDKPLLLTSDCPACCKKVNIYPGIDADNLMRIKYIVKYTKFARDYNGTGWFYLIDKKGFKRTRKWARRRIILNKNGIDYKDLVVVTEPQNIKGLSVLAWTYTDPDKEQETWLWLPSQRKVRRVSPSEADDSAMGTDWTTEEMSTRKWEDETYSFVKEKEIFEGYTSRYNKKTYYKGAECFVVEARPKIEPWYYSKRILWIPKNIGGQVFDEIYDPNGKKFKEVCKVYEIRDNACLPQIFLECADLRTDHLTVNEFEKVEFNTGLDEKLFSVKSLMRTKW